MSEKPEFSISALRQKRGQSNPESGPDRLEPTKGPATSALPSSPPTIPRPGRTSGQRFWWDQQRFLAGLIQRQWWLILAGCVGLALGLFLGTIAIPYHVNFQLLQQNPARTIPQNTAESPRSPELKPATLTELLRSRELLRKVCDANDPLIQPPLKMEELARAVQLHFNTDSEVVTVDLAVPGSRKRCLAIANRYRAELQSYFQQLSMGEIAATASAFEEKLSQLESDQQRATEDLERFSQNHGLIDWEKQLALYLDQRNQLDLRLKTAQVDAEALAARIQFLKGTLSAPTAENDQLRSARLELTALLMRYTDAHPTVQAQRAKISMLENQGTLAKTAPNAEFPPSPDAPPGTVQRQWFDLEAQNVTLTNTIKELVRQIDQLQTNLTHLSTQSQEFARLQSRLQECQNARTILAHRLREVQWLDHRLADLPAGFYRPLGDARENEIQVARRWRQIALAALGGAVLSLLAVAGLIGLIELADSRLKTIQDVQYATQLPVLASLGDLGQMSEADQTAWAFHTWTILGAQLGHAANRGVVCGLISAHPGEGRSTWIKLLAAAANQRGLRVLTVTASHPNPSTPPSETTTSPETEQTVDQNLNPLTQPQFVARQLSRPNALALVQVPLHQGIWDLEHRRHWQQALAQWRGIEDLVLLVELPPANQPEALLLAETVPQVLWLTSSGQSRIGETRFYLEALRHARCHLVGAVLNREPSHPLLNRLFRRFTPTR